MLIYEAAMQALPAAPAAGARIYAAHRQRGAGRAKSSVTNGRVLFV